MLNSLTSCVLRFEKTNSKEGSVVAMSLKVGFTGRFKPRKFELAFPYQISSARERAVNGFVSSTVTETGENGTDLGIKVYL